MPHDPFDTPAFARQIKLGVAEANPVGLDAPGPGFRNFLGRVPVGNHYRAGGAIGPDLKLTTEGRVTLHEAMQRAAARFSEEAHSARAVDESQIPSGYTYLLQLIAHDLVDTTASVRLEQSPPGLTLSNARRELLMLETLYGAGPAHAPFAYEPESRDRDFPDIVTRQRLRLGRRLARPHGARLCPGIDIPRALSTNRAENDRAVRTEPLIADPRNDAHALISQMAVLFHLLHNAVVDRLERHREPGRPHSLDEAARFLCARLTTALIYRAIILADLLPRLLNPQVARYYLVERRPLCDTSPGVPLEFSHGVFRAAHAMVRDSYKVNSSSPESGRAFSDALLVSSKRARGETPMTAAWIVDWALFFDTNGQRAVNRAMRLRPRYANALTVKLPPKHPQRDYQGLAARDVLSASYARMWSPVRLARQLAESFGGIVTPGAADEFAQWLGTDPSMQALAHDPPWPLFSLWEAEAHGGGERLGPIGSIVFAETILGAMQQFPIAGSPFEPLANSIEHCCATLLGEASRPALSDMSAIDSMPKLLELLETEWNRMERET